MNDTTTTTKNPSHSLQDILQQKGGKQRRSSKIWWLLLLVLLAGGAGWHFLNAPPANQQQGFQTEAVKQGNLRVTVTATGNLQPLNQVDIGTELSGTVDSVLVDTNDVVKKGQELARLNTTQLNDIITKGKASLASAQAKVKQSAATVKEAQVKLSRLRQLQSSSGGKLPAKADLDAAEATLERAQADEAVAKATVTSAQADLRSSQTNLGKAIITSPIDGVVLDRAIEPGQTVASSLSAPTLFTLAEDLAKMELQVSVDEADVGQVKAGQQAEFTVDAWPGRKYSASITRVSLGSTITNNVVSYTTDLAVSNGDLSLRPCMTATATVTTQARDNALLVPNAALHFTLDLPTTSGDGGVAPEPPKSGSVFSKLMPMPPMQPKQKRTTTPAQLSSGEQQVWVLDANRLPEAITVKTGISDGKHTEIVAGELAAGVEVITSATEGGTAP